MQSVINHKNDLISPGDETLQAINVSVAYEYKELNFPLSIIYTYILPIHYPKPHTSVFKAVDHTKTINNDAHAYTHP